MKTILKNIVLGIIVTTILTCILFWHEIKTSLSHTVSSTFSDSPACSNESVIYDIYLPLENNLHRIFITELQANKQTNQSIDITFLLNNQGGNNAYPALHIYLFDKNGQTTRHLDLSHDQYTHGTKLTKERITLNVPLLHGETAFDIKPFYPGDGL